MSTKNVRFIVICEDREHEGFVRGALERVGFQRHNMDVKLPPGGSGEQWVRIETTKWVPRIRAHASRVAVALISVIDADALTVEERRKQMEHALKTSGCPPRKPGEPIAFLIPRRNIETWIRFLLDGDANESHDYKNQIRSGEPRKAGSKFPEACQSDSSLIASLQTGCAEFKAAVAAE